MDNFHTPVLLKESIEGLNINPAGTYVDVTFGGGGHSKEILNHLNASGRLIAFDQDKDAEANRLNDNRFEFIQHNFKFVKNFLRFFKISKVDGIFADLGVSAHHFNAPQRGFSFRFDSPLDMRMNKGKKNSAKEIVNEYSEEQLIHIFKTYGELIQARKIAWAIVNARKTESIDTTGRLLEVIEHLIPFDRRSKFLAQVFQALRIEVNMEMENLKIFLSQTPELLAKDGRLVIITYHSLEDRLVKNFMRSGNFEGEIQKDFFGNVIAPFETINKKVIIPEDSEIEINKQSRSAKLRIAQRQ